MPVADSGRPAGVEVGAVDELERILYHITHDLRASLRAIRTLPEWLQEDLRPILGTFPPEVADSFELLEIHTGRMDRMLEDLLTYSRIGRRSDRPSEINLSNVLDEVADALGWPVEAELISAFSIEQIEVPANDIHTLFSVFLSNALKHAGGATKEMRVGTELDGDWLVIFAADRGPGIPVVHRDKVFDMLTTLASRDEVEGSGMGLAIARKICTELGGSIDVSDRPDGPGACFRARLPVRVITAPKASQLRLAQC